MVTCSVLDCDVNQRNNPAKYSFHRFPTNEDVRKTWLKLINRPNWIPTKYATLCSKHFDSKCFRKIGARITLKKCAIPTEFVPMKVKPTRTMSSYVNRDILPEGSTLSSRSPPPTPQRQPTPSTSFQKLKSKCAKLQEKIKKKTQLIRNLRSQNKRTKIKVVTLASFFRKKL